MAQREDLYRDFVVAASEAYGKAIINSEAQIQDLVILHGLIGRMRILSSSEVIACAEDTVKIIMDTYYSPNKTILELRELIRNGKFIDPTRKFSETSRQELAVS